MPDNDQIMPDNNDHIMTGSDQVTKTIDELKLERLVDSKYANNRRKGAYHGYGLDKLVYDKDYKVLTPSFVAPQQPN